MDPRVNVALAVIDPIACDTLISCIYWFITAGLPKVRTTDTVFSDIEPETGMLPPGVCIKPLKLEPD